MVAHLGKAAGTRGFAADDRLAPEHPFPAALNESGGGRLEPHPVPF
jgi:acetyl esterase/lipase